VCRRTEQAVVLAADEQRQLAELKGLVRVAAPPLARAAGRHAAGRRVVARAAEERAHCGGVEPVVLGASGEVGRRERLVDVAEGGAARLAPQPQRQLDGAGARAQLGDELAEGGGGQHDLRRRGVGGVGLCGGGGKG